MKIVLLTNILTPYRKSFYDSLYNVCLSKNIDFEVLLMAQTEPNRNWEYDDFKMPYTKLLSSRTLTYKSRFIHFNRDTAKILKESSPDIVIASGGYIFPAVWTAIRMKRKLGYTLLFWSESHLNEKRDYSLSLIKARDSVRKIVYSKFDGFWYAGDLSKQFIQTYADPTANYYFVPNLINESKFYQANKLRNSRNKYRIKWELEYNKFIFICPARLTGVKGLLPFLKVFSESSLNEKVSILIPGEGDQKDTILKFIEEKGLDVKLLGYKSEDELVELYALSDSFLLPSLSDPNPLSCIEAVWAGLPLFVSRHVGNYPEVIISGVNGYVFSYDKTKELIDRLNDLVNASDEWKKNAQHISLAIAQENYSTNAVCDRLTDEMLSIKKEGINL